MNTGDDRDMKNERHSHRQDDYQFLKDCLAGGREKSKKITVNFS